MKLPTALAQAIARRSEQFSAKELATAAAELSQRYRSATARPAALGSELERAAYLLTRMPATFAACSAVLRELTARAPELLPVSMLDLGSGPGTAAWAAAGIFPQLQKLELVDSQPDMVKLGRQLAGFGVPALQRANWICVDAKEYPHNETFDLVMLAYSLGEIRERDRTAIIDRAWRQAGQALVIIEPGTPRGYSVMLGAREQLISARAHLLAPCPHEEKCPMAGIKDWCHFAARLERSAEHRRLKSGSLGYEDEKFSYVIFTRSRSQAERAGARVVRHPIHGKGHIKLELCARDGLQQITVTRSQGEAFRRARKAEWGDAWG